MQTLIAIGGPTGSGKTTLAYAMKRRIAELSDAAVIDNDQVRRDLLGYDLRYTMKDEDYTDEVSLRVQALVDEITRSALEKGVDVIDSSGYWSELSRSNVEALAVSCGAHFIGIWLDVPHDVLALRILRRLEERAVLKELSVERGHASDACLGVLEKYGCFATDTLGTWLMIDGFKPKNMVLEEVRLSLTQKRLK